MMERYLLLFQIKMNCQLVLCPGYNDGAELERTLGDLLEYENVRTALVRSRGGLSVVLLAALLQVLAALFLFGHAG